MSVAYVSSVSADTFMASFAKQCALLVETLGTVIALTENAHLRDLALARCGFATGISFAAGLGVDSAWIEFAQGSDARIMRARPKALTSIDIAALSASDGDFGARLTAASTAPHVAEAAMRKLDFLFRPLPWPTREEAVALESLIPLLEKPAYSLCAASTALLDRKRRILVPLLKTSEARNDALLSYWAIVQIMARLTLLASDTAARPWLAEMAQTFQWQRWTPSMPLVRERTCWLAACAARSVIAFGPAILPNYLGMLARSKHPMTTFDALYGLSAIALSEPEELTPLTHEVSSLRKVVIRNDPATHNFTDHLFSNCLATLYARGQVTDDAAALSQAFNWQRGKPNGLASSVAIRTDPTDTLSSGRVIGFAILPLVVEAPKESFYPVQSASSREHALHAREIEQFFRRAWIDSDAPSVVYH